MQIKKGQTPKRWCLGIISSVSVPFALLLLQFMSLATSALVAHADSSVSVGMLLPLTGSYAAVGADNQQGIEIAKSEIDPNVKINFVIADSRADPVQSVNEFRKLVETDQVLAVFAFRGPVGMAVNPLSKNYRVPVLGGVGNKDFALANEYAFQLWPRSDIEGGFLAGKLLERRFRHIAILTAQDDWLIAVTSGFRSELEESGHAPAIAEEFLPTDADFRTIISKIRMTNADAVFANLGVTQIGPFIKQLREQNVPLPVFSTFWAAKKEVLASAPAAMEGVEFAEMATDLEILRMNLKEKFGSSPSGATLSAYVGTLMLAQALEGEKNPSREAIQNKLSAMTSVKTKNGNFPVKNRVVQFPLVMRTIRNGVVVNSN